MAEVQVSALLVEVGVNFGDHGETTTQAVEVSRDETIGEVIDRLLTRASFSAPFEPVAAGDKRIELRAIVSAERAS